MKRIIKKIFMMCGFGAAIIAGAYGIPFFIRAPAPQTVTWGVNFSQMQAESLGLDWKKVYTAILEDLGAQKIRLMTNWNFVEGTKGQYFFNDTDWQIAQAERNGAQLIWIVGMKTGRWPECHLPAWAENLSKEEQQQAVLSYITALVSRYKSSPAIEMWQAENEPLFHFGRCPWYDKEFLKKEVALIKSLDPNHPVLVSDSGEQSLWWRAATIGDVVGTTMYRRVWVHITKYLGFYTNLPVPPSTYWIKSAAVKKLFGKKVINVELQTEPWTPEFFYDLPLNVQEASMNLAEFTSTIDYARRTGFDTFYFWGVEWWYWLKTAQNKPDVWNNAKEIIRSNH